MALQTDTEMENSFERLEAVSVSPGKNIASVDKVMVKKKTMCFPLYKSV